MWFCRHWRRNRTCNAESHRPNFTINTFNFSIQFIVTSPEMDLKNFICFTYCDYKNFKHNSLSQILFSPKNYIYEKNFNMIYQDI